MQEGEKVLVYTNDISRPTHDTNERLVFGGTLNNVFTISMKIVFQSFKNLYERHQQEMTSYQKLLCPIEINISISLY